MGAYIFTTQTTLFFHYEGVCKALEKSCSYCTGHEECCIWWKYPRHTRQK